MERVAEVVPLKQGLKPDGLIEIKNNISNCCRGSSIKTRIETNFIQLANWIKKEVAEVVPLKQGLKQAEYENITDEHVVAEVVPLKQGLKLPPYPVVLLHLESLQR